jgi:hypothetical protein
MAVYAGATRRSSLASRPSLAPRTRRPADVAAEEPAIRRRTRTATVRAGRRTSRVGIVLGGIAIAFVLGLFSLAQTVRVSATSFDIDQLIYERDRMTADGQQLRSDLSRLGSEPAIRKEAFDLGLSQLGDALVVPAR